MAKFSQSLAMHAKKIFRQYVNSNPVLLMMDLPVCFLSHTRMWNTGTVAQQISMSLGVPLVILSLALLLSYIAIMIILI